MFRGKENALQPNWLNMPIAYNGRKASIQVGEGVRRPKGQIREGVWSATEKLDYEAEVAAVIGRPST